jgi:hypothetical protein
MQVFQGIRTPQWLKYCFVCGTVYGDGKTFERRKTDDV